jgi:hypothetical protein
MGIMYSIKCCCSELHKYGCFQSTMWLLQNLRQSTDEWNFISNYENTTRKIFRSDFSVLQIMVVCYHIYTFRLFLLLLLLLLLLLWECWIIKS